MSRKATDPVTTIGIDIGKNSFHLIGLDGRCGSWFVLLPLSTPKIIGCVSEHGRSIPLAEMPRAGRCNFAQTAP